MKSRIAVSCVFLAAILMCSNVSPQDPDGDPFGFIGEVSYSCPDGQGMSLDGWCLADLLCTDKCEEDVAECGEVCGESCGDPCADGEICLGWKCVAGVDLSCAVCSLRLSVVDSQGENGRLVGVTLAVEYHPATGEPRPRLADIRIRPNMETSVEKVELGPALNAASKHLYEDPESGDPWQIRGDGSIQFLVLAIDNVNEIAPGRLFAVTLRMDARYAVFRLRRRDQTFAPQEADAAIRLSAYDSPVVVMP